MAGGSNKIWYHRQLGRMETEKLLIESKEDGSFLIRASDTVRGAYVLSTIYQQRIHHYRIIPNEEGMLSIQAQQGVQKKQFTHLDEMVEYYSHARRGLVCALTIPIAQRKQVEEEVTTVTYDSDDDNETDADSESKEKDEKNLVSKFLLAFLSTMDTSKVDDSFLEQVRQYLSRDVSADIESMTTPTPRLDCFKQLFQKDTLILHKQLNKMMAQLDLMKALFERAGGANAATTRHMKSSANDSTYDTLGFKLSDCADSVTSLETIAFQMLRELSTSMSGSRGVSSSSLVQPVANGVVKSRSLPREGSDQDEVTFDVKLDQGLSGRKNQMIMVNLKQCHFQFFKPGDSQRQTYEHSQLLQLVKSRSRDSRLGVVFQGQSRKEYIFNDMQARERFCQLTQLIRNRMLAGEDQDIISIFVGTWNMGDAPPPGDLNSWIQSLGLGKTLPTALAQSHDLYAFGTQETGIVEKEWIAKLRQTLKSLYDVDYEKVVCQSLWGMRCVIMAKPEHMNKISHVQTTSVKTGIGNTLGNKGGVGISFFFGSVSLGFICTHLTSGNEKCHRRNQNYHDILKGMSSLKQKKLSQFDLTNQFTHLFFFGDLNYRVDLGATEIVEYAKKFDHYSIYQEDQLRKEREKQSVFVDYEEAPILYPPTYRFQRGSRTLDDYVWVKQKRAGIRINVPSYCDRVLWRSYPGTSIVNTSYGCTDDIVTSDHSPVFATFQMHGFKQYASEAGEIKNQNAQIMVLQSSAKIATSSKTNFYMEFYSSCLEGSIKTQPNHDFVTSTDASYTCPVWRPSRDSLASMTPIVKEEGYLEQQHLLVMLKSQEGDEPYAECCLSLRGVIGREPVTVSRKLTHQGHAVGELEISIHVTLDTYRQKKAEEELYTEVNFITQDETGSNGGISLDKPGARRGRNSDPDGPRQRDSTGSRGGDNSKPSSRDLLGGSRGAEILKNPNSRDALASRPMLPIPRANSQSGGERHRVGMSSGGATLPSSTPAPSSLPPGQPPPPLPTRRRDLNAAVPPLPISQRPLVATPSTRPMDVPPPAVPHRRGAETLGASRSQQYSRSEPAKSDSFDRGLSAPHAYNDPSKRNTTQPSAPVPTKRRGVPRQFTSPTPTLEQNPPFPPPSSRPQPPLPSSPRSRQPSDTLPPMPAGQGPPVPKRQGARSPRPPSSVESLLQAHGLQHFSDRLLNNGYDDLHFLAEVADSELQEIGIAQSADREKLLRVFRAYAAHNH